VALDRQSIERRDFPVGEHGYAPAAVDAHLSALATEVEQLKQTSGRSETLAASASGRVHAIIEAAETSAAEIQRAAEDEARGIRDQANHDAHAAREQANHDAHAAREQAAEEARGYLGRVSEATNAMMQRLDAIHQEFGALMEATRAGSARLHADVQQLEIDLARAREGVIPPPGAQAPTAAEPALGHGPEPSGASAPEAAEFAEIVGSGETISPDPGEVSFARRIIAAMPDGTGAVMIDGKMQDDATWKQAKVLLDLAKLIAAKDPDMGARYGL